MSNFSIIMTPDATNDIVEICNYISEVLQSPETALEYIQSIRNDISKLEYMANTIAPLHDEPWHSKGLRKIISKNFYVYYRIDEENKTVYILNIIYNKRNQLKQISKLKFEDE